LALIGADREDGLGLGHDVALGRAGEVGPLLGVLLGGLVLSLDRAGVLEGCRLGVVGRLVRELLVRGERILRRSVGNRLVDGALLVLGALLGRGLVLTVAAGIFGGKGRHVS